MAEPYYISSPIYYVNDTPHIGHAYTTLACDVLARFYRSSGREVFFLTGTDEHGQKVEKAAHAKGSLPQDFTDKVSGNFQQLATLMQFSQDDFIRTTQERHRIATQALWQKMEEAGDIYLGDYAGWYAVRDEAYYDESELKKDANGNKIAPTGAMVEWVKEPSYFFKLSRYQQPLLDHYSRYPESIMPPERRNEVLSFINSGLRDLSISRTTFNWGIRVPNNDRHVVYVWVDALTNYLTALGYPDTDAPKYKKFWPANVHMVGKDILRFHAVYWPAFLLSASLPLPHRIYAHGWWTNEGEKISKTAGNIIDPVTLIDTYGLDKVRYFLMREVPFGQDGNFSHQSMINRINSDLANDYGNLCQRVLTMIQRNCQGKIPPCHQDHKDDADHHLLETVASIRDSVVHAMDQQQLQRALVLIWQGFSAANVYIDRQAPWVLRKTNTSRMEVVLYTLLEAIRRLTILLTPFIPQTCERVFVLLSADITARTMVGFDNALESGVELLKPSPILPRFEETQNDNIHPNE